MASFSFFGRISIFMLILLCRKLVNQFGVSNLGIKGNREKYYLIIIPALLH